MANGMDTERPAGQQWLLKAKRLYDNVRVAPEDLENTELAARQARVIAGGVTAIWTNRLREFFPDGTAAPESGSATRPPA